MRHALITLTMAVCLAGSELRAQPAIDPKLQALEKTFSAEQQRLFQEHIDLRVQQAARFINPAAPALRTPNEIRRAELAQLSPPA
jgi:hypothetical protein